MRLKYAAKTRDGKTVKRGEIDAPDRDSAIKSLREHDLVVYSLAPVNERNPLELFAKWRGIPLPEIVKFTDQLSSMLTAGLPLTKSLELLVLQTKNQLLSDAIQQTLNEVEGGTPLAKAFQNRGEVFTKSYINLVKAGEASGKLDEVLTQLAEALEKERQFKSKVRGALLYPAIVTSAMVIVFVLIVVFLIPQMTDIYEAFEVDLPITTRILIGISDFFINYWWAAIGIFIAMIVGFRIFQKSPGGDYFLAQLSFRLPVFGTIIQQSLITEFTRTIGLLSQAGVPLVEALEIAEDGMGNVIYKRSIGSFIDDVKHGYPLSQTIAKDPHFPPIIPQMLLVGEETGTIDKRLTGLSKYYEGEVDKIVKNLSTAMEPMIMILLGILVGLLVISVILPIYQLTTSIT